MHIAPCIRQQVEQLPCRTCQHGLHQRAAAWAQQRVVGAQQGAGQAQQGAEGGEVVGGKRGAGGTRIQVVLRVGGG